MRACLFAASYLDGSSGNGDSYYLRWTKYLRFYSRIAEELGVEDVVLIDNASSPINLGWLYNDWNGIGLNIRIQRYANHLPRMPGWNGYGYPYGWRMIYAVTDFLDAYDKIIFIDSDGFVCSDKLARWVKGLKSGWSSLWCPRWNFPEANMSVLCADTYQRFVNYLSQTDFDYMGRLGECMEVSLPFTEINKDFVSDRFGETRERQRPDMDFYAQCPLDIDIKYGMIK